MSAKTIYLEPDSMIRRSFNSIFSLRFNFSIALFIYDPIIVNYLEFFLITTASIFINAAIFLVTTALRMAQKYYSSVFCLVYLQVVWSSLVGIFIFDEYMNLFAYFGAFFIVLSGIFSIPSQLKQLKK